ncbi:hypothetical protein [Rhizobium leguminosarum]|uniref:Uncharacterized protein n=1 Tax=Rhizobium leguminosarum TaxID=384 RepID=A0A2K9ZCS4_RHILE|nr:hypothetical protein CUJ84_pRLN1000558 [Rhizobium leguminosarum]
MATVYPFKLSVRLLGVTLSSLTNDQTSHATEGHATRSKSVAGTRRRKRKACRGGGAASAWQDYFDGQRSLEQAIKRLAKLMKQAA